MNSKQRIRLANDIKASADRIASDVGRGNLPHKDDYILLREDLETLYRETRPVLVKLKQPAKKRISAKWVGYSMKLALQGTGSHTLEENVLLKIEGEGENSRATFRDTTGMEWQAYRFRGRWAYGAGANRISVINDD